MPKIIFLSHLWAEKSQKYLFFYPLFFAIIPQLASEKYVDAFENSEKFRGTWIAKNYFSATFESGDFVKMINKTVTQNTPDVASFSFYHHKKWSPRTQYSGDTPDVASFWFYHHKKWSPSAVETRPMMLHFRNFFLIHLSALFRVDPKYPVWVLKIFTKFAACCHAKNYLSHLWAEKSLKYLIFARFFAITSSACFRKICGCL